MCRKLYLFIIFFYSNLFFILTADVGDKCTPNAEAIEGSCVLVVNCEVAVRGIRTRGFHGFARCGFSGSTEIVCCPNVSENHGSETERRDDSSTTTALTTSTRVADRECKKIIDTTIPPLTLNILGGEDADLGEFPHMVALGFDKGQGLSFDCGGSLVSTVYVLTAAHCIVTLDGIEPSVVRAGVVELGPKYFNDNTDIRIAEVKVHPNYTRREKYHDLALLRLAKPVETSVNLKPACIYTRNDDPVIPLTVTGWGTVSNTRDIRSEILLKANVTVVSRSQCSESYTNWRKLPIGISTEQICAGDKEGIRDTCQGDSGGPLQGITENDGNYRLIGVTSFGRGCGSPVPGVYTRLTHYLDWIESVVWTK